MEMGFQVSYAQATYQCGTQLLLLPTDQDVERSAPSPAPHLLYAAMPPAMTEPLECTPAPLKHLLRKSCPGRGAASQQQKPQDQF